MTATPASQPAEGGGPAPKPAPPPPARGRAIVGASLWGTAAFVLLAVAAAVSPEVLAGPALVLDVVLFGAGCVVFAVAFLGAAGRSRTDAIGIGGLFFLAGEVAPAGIRRRLIGAFAVETVVGLATAGARLYTNLAAGVLVPVYGLALCGLWAARYGRFDPRTPPARPAEPKPPTQ
ncbi:MAG: hypothetical protein QOI56_766 [Actinomycetota bacterium]|nr:hypothetical protein [Actinomycetota bacterium]